MSIQDNQEQPNVEPKSNNNDIKDYSQDIANLSQQLNEIKAMIQANKEDKTHEHRESNKIKAYY